MGAGLLVEKIVNVLFKVSKMGQGSILSGRCLYCRKKLSSNFEERGLFVETSVKI